MKPFVNLDDYLEEYKNSESSLPFHEFLGMSIEEYEIFAAFQVPKSFVEAMDDFNNGRVSDMEPLFE